MKEDDPIEGLYDFVEHFLHDVERMAEKYMRKVEKMEQTFNKNGGL